MTAEDRAIRTARRALKRAEREAKRKVRDAKRLRKERIRTGGPIIVSSEPSYEAMRGARFTMFCEVCRLPFPSESMEATRCEFCK